MTIGCDFDGTLAVWPRGVRVDYDNPQWALANSAAVLGTVKWLRAALSCGHTVVIITGRGAEHNSSLQYWLRHFIGHRLPVVTRPGHVGLDCESLAARKAAAMVDAGVSVYVGDNPRIDKAAAQMAHVHFLDAMLFRAGNLPPLPVNLGAVNGSSE